MSLVESGLKWLKVPRDSETIWRSIERKLKGLDFGSSSPLMSGDTFKLRCDQILEGVVTIRDLDFDSLSNFRGRFYIQAKPLSNAIDVLLSACQSGLRAPHADLVIHNGDEIPSATEMKIFSQVFRRVYSVNWLGDSAIALPLPIGLENRDKRRNGVPQDYLREMEKGTPSFYSRPISLLACFSLHTNFAERSRALEGARRVPGAKIVTGAITPKQYRKLLLQSRFVLSPPGNGPDCHRTWEALYLGATPIVSKASWPFVDYDLPVSTTNSWTNLQEIVSSKPVTANESWRDIESWLPKS